MWLLSLGQQNSGDKTMIGVIVLGVFVVIAVIFLISGIRIVRPVEIGLIERLGKPDPVVNITGILLNLKSGGSLWKGL